ncbi:MAG: LPS assembly protein LptD [Gammaproteobacteria bacterium]
MSRPMLPMILFALQLPLQPAAFASGHWDCTTTPDGHWDCIGNHAMLALETGQAASLPAASSTPASTATDTAVRTGPEPLSGTADVSSSATIPPQPADSPPGGSGELDTGRWSLCPPLTGQVLPALTGQDETGGNIELDADGAESPDGNTYHLQGNAIIRYEQQELRADSIVYERSTGDVEASGGIQLSGTGFIINAATAELQIEAQQGILHQVDFTLPNQHARGKAAQLSLDGIENLHLEKASYTTCPEGNENWILLAREVHLDREDGRGTARGAKLKFKGVPLLYTPYFSFPIDERRKSGLLIPKIGQSDTTGSDISIPYYWNIAPDRDATLVPRLMSSRGLMLGAEFRYLNRRSKGEITAQYLPSDDRFGGEDRSLTSLHHTGNPVPRLQTYIKASNASDMRYFEDFGSDLVNGSQTQLERTAAATWFGDWWNARFRVQDFQNLDPTITRAQRPYKQLPQITFSVAPENSILGMQFNVDTELNYFSHSDSSITEGTRLYIHPRVSLPITTAAWYITPAVSLRHTRYSLVNVAPDTVDNPDRTVPAGSVDAGMFFERTSHWGRSDLVQTLEPRLFYLYVPNKDQSEIPVFDTGDFDFNFWTLFRENRFSGPDRMGDANQLAAALTTRILDPATGRQLFSASLGELFYFRDREVTLPGAAPETDNSSALISELTLAPWKRWSANAGLQWDPHAAKAVKQHYQLQYRVGPRQLVNAGYRYQLDILEQADFSLLWPISRSWHMVGRWYYSLDGNELIEGLAGLGYESCCWSAQLVGRRYINSDMGGHQNAVFLQLELKGMGQLGSKIDKLLERGILGY